MTYNPKIHHRRSIRLKGYDYSNAGLYFITICVKNHQCLFGNIVENKIILNDAGYMVEKWYYELENKYPDKKCREMIVMPNHFHCIVENTKIMNKHGMSIRDVNGTTIRDAHVGTSLHGRPKTNEPILKPQYGINNKKYIATIGDTMDWFKTMTTNEYIHGVKIYNWKRFDKKLWQRNYWEHIIRNGAEYKRIADYINENPAKWIDDKFNPQNSK